MGLRTFDIAQAIPALWATGVLDQHFTQYWTNQQKADYLVLMDEGAAPTQPWPYCVFEVIASTQSSRSSASTPQRNRQEINEDTIRFHVFAKDRTLKSGKRLCSDLVEEILKVFGGHPEETHQDLPLQNGAVVNQEYNQTILMQEDEGIWKATVIYSVFYELSLKD